MVSLPNIYEHIWLYLHRESDNAQAMFDLRLAYAELSQRDLRGFMYKYFFLNGVDEWVEDSIQQTDEIFEVTASVSNYRWIKNYVENADVFRFAGEFRKSIEDFIKKCDGLRSSSEILEGYFVALGGREPGDISIGAVGASHIEDTDQVAKILRDLEKEISRVILSLPDISTLPKRRPGRPSSVAKKWLIFRAADLYDKFQVSTRKAGISQSPIRSGGDPYSGPFYTFLQDFMNLVDPDLLSGRSQNSGLGSTVEKLLNARRTDGEINGSVFPDTTAFGGARPAIGLNPFAEPEVRIRLVGKFGAA